MTRPEWLAAEEEIVSTAPWASRPPKTPGWYARKPEEPKSPAFLGDAKRDAVPSRRPPSLPPPAVPGAIPRHSSPPVRAARASFLPPEGGFAVPPPPSFETPPPAEESEAELAYLAARDEFACAAAALAAAKLDLAQSMEERLWTLAIDVAEAIVEDRAERHPELERSFARVALESLDASGVAKLRVSRRTWDALVDVFGSAKIDLDGRRAELVLDPSIEGLGCIAEHEDSRVDGRLKERFEAVRRAYHEGLLTEAENQPPPKRSEPIITNSIAPPPPAVPHSEADALHEPLRGPEPKRSIAPSLDTAHGAPTPEPAAAPLASAPPGASAGRISSAAPISSALPRVSAYPPSGETAPIETAALDTAESTSRLTVSDRPRISARAAERKMGRGSVSPKEDE